MKLVVHRLWFLVSLLFILGISLWIKWPLSIGTSLNDLIPQQGINEEAFKVLNKYTSIVSIIVEGDDFSQVKSDSDLIYEYLTRNNVKNIIYRIPQNAIEKGMDLLCKHPTSYLLEQDRDDILNEKYSTILNRSINYITSSFTPFVEDLEKDPFTILSRYGTNFSEYSMKWIEKSGVLTQNYNGKAYVFMNIPFSSGNVQLGEKVLKLLQSLSSHLDIKGKIYFTGVPIHTYEMYHKTRLEILFFTLISASTILILTFLLFKSFKVTTQIVLNLAIAFASGVALLVLFSQQIHIMTFVFGSAMIGICIDYSFHSTLFRREQSEKFKNLLYSYLTTICCFIPLLFSSVDILRQIAIFMIGSLSGTFVWVVLMRKREYVSQLESCQQPAIGKLIKYICSILMVLIILIGLPNLKFQNDIGSLYKSPENLKQSDELFYKLNARAIQNFLLVKADTLEELLQIEEKLKEGNNFFSLSSILPSIKKQKENYILIKELYKKEANNIRRYLGLEKELTLPKESILTKDEFMKQFGNEIIDRYIIEHNNKIWSITPLESDITLNNKNATLINSKAILRDNLDKFASEMNKFLLISVFALGILLSFIYKKKVILYLIPSFFAVLGALSLFSLFNVSISFFHLISMFLVIGLSIDYTIFHLNNTVNNNFIPVLFSYLSSAMSFGILYFASFPMISTMGLTIFIGLSLSYFLSLILSEK